MPVYVMPLVFGFAPIVNTLVTAWMSKTFDQISPIFMAESYQHRWVLVACLRSSQLRRRIRRLMIPRAKSIRSRRQMRRQTIMRRDPRSYRRFAMFELL